VSGGRRSAGDRDLGPVGDRRCAVVGRAAGQRWCPPPLLECELPLLLECELPLLLECELPLLLECELPLLDDEPPECEGEPLERDGGL